MTRSLPAIVALIVVGSTSCGTDPVPADPGDSATTAPPDAGPEDIDRAIAAARRAFDETDWSRDHALRARCLRQLQDAYRANLEELRKSYIAEVGCPVQMTYGPALDVPVDSLSHYADFLEKYEWSEDPG